jgi:hypothetical protein
MRSIPGTYSPNAKKCNGRLTLVDSESAYHAGITLHGSLSAMQQYVSDVVAQKLEEYNERVLRSRAEWCGSTRRLRRPRTEDIYDGSSGNPLRLVAIVRTPWLNTVSRELECGFHCIGCQRCYCSRPLNWRRKFTAASFSEHLEQCGNIKNGKHHLD